MIKFTIKILLCCIALSCFSFSHATLITNLTQTELDARDYTNAEDQLFDTLLGVNYIEHNGYDWAWVSPINIETFGTNTLYAPEVQKSWQFADASLLNILATELTLADFTAANGDTIQATEFFNSEFNSVDPSDFRLARSELTIASDPMAFIFSSYETFYIRPSDLRPSAPSLTVPEPSTLMVFALGLIALASKKRLFS